MRTLSHADEHLLVKDLEAVQVAVKGSTMHCGPAAVVREIELSVAVVQDLQGVAPAVRRGSVRGGAACNG